MTEFVYLLIGVIAVAVAYFVGHKHGREDMVKSLPSHRRRNVYNFTTKERMK